MTDYYEVTDKQIRCIICGNKVRTKLKSKLCASCKSRNLYREKYEQLKQETDRKFKLYDIFIKDLTKRLNKYEPVEEQIE